MTGAQMDDLLMQLLGDPNSRRWDQTNHRLPALNSAYRQVVMKVLGMAQRDDSMFDLLQGLQASQTVGVNVTGYTVSGLTNEMFSETGFMSAQVTLDGEDQWCVRYTTDQKTMKQNRYLRGNNEYPVIRFEGGKMYVDIDNASYPTDVTLYYIKTPSTIADEATEPDVDDILHDTIVLFAEAECRRMADDFVQAAKILEEANSNLALLARGSAASIKSGTPGQYLRERGASNAV